jgi:hypothetical protein
MIEYIETQLKAAKDQPDDWVECVDKPDFSVKRHKEGSYLDKSNILFYSNGELNKTVLLSRALNALYNPEHKKIWEKKNIEKYVILETSHKNVFLPYTKYKKMLTFN